MEPPSSTQIDVVSRFAENQYEELLSQAVVKTLDQESASNRVVSVLLCDDQEIRQLNSTYRAIDEATDVLSFASDPFPGSPLGDIVISLPYAERQAEARGVPITVELSYLAIHGTLHLLGYDDETEPDRTEMWKVTLAVAHGLGLPPDPEWQSVLAGGAT